MKELTADKAWALIAEIGWGSRTTDYKHVAETYFKLLGKKGMKQLEDFVGAKVYELGKAVSDYETLHGTSLEVGSDDGFSDLRYHIVGMGKHEFDRCIADPPKMQIRSRKGEYTESFAYAFQEPEPPRTKAQKQKELRSLLTEIPVLSAELGRTEKQLDNLKMRMDILTRLANQVKEDLKSDWGK